MLKKFSTMKELLLAILIILFGLTASAQTDSPDQKKLFDQYWMLGVKYGFAQFHGDVNDKGFWAKLPDESKPSFGFTLGRQLSPVFSVKADFSKSNYYGRNQFQVYDSIKATNVSVNGNITEFGIYGTLNLNKLFSKSKASGDHWNAYVSSGLGLANWRCKLKDDDHDLIIRTIGYSNTGKTTRKSALSVPVTLGANIKLTDGIMFSLEHAIHFVNSDLVDAYSAFNYDDIYTTTSIGITVNLQKLSFPGFKSKGDNRSLAKTPRRSWFGKKPRSLPEIQEYTGYNGLMPVAAKKNDTTSASGSAGKKQPQNVWAAEVDSGRYEITGGKK
ncbi:MAG: outer membrane beta-barrel protein, partial [Bacteroidota bacterium]|nr:outer membrane beta-barrel protein [Bacteroidota bacterium]